MSDVVAQSPRKPTRWELVAAGAGSGALISIIDFTKNPNDGTIFKLANGLGKLCFPSGSPPPGPSPILIAIFFVVLASLFVCWLFELKDRAEAFLRSCALLAAFSVVTPGTINQIADVTAVQGGTLLTKQKSSSLIFESAFAANGQPEDDAAPAGTAYVVLKNLQNMAVMPESIVTIRNERSYEPISIFRIRSFRIPLVQTYGRLFRIQIDTPGFRSIEFSLRVREPIEAYGIRAPETALYFAVQAMASPLKVELAPNEAEQLKQNGRNKLIGDNIEGAISQYIKSLQLADDDAETKHFLGYAYFRAGQYAEAKEILSKLNLDFPNSSLIALNLIKVKCGLKDEAVRSQLRSANEEWRKDWSFDGEFVRICNQYVD
ncbi:tetratricopeptide repeat protein [Bradyrhizobium sp. OK095]|uniref:tetratricopeptide repeat protein n=1 Tax=Bradyrhizobium sp. OK095 TaxID=1882760 RepID=UPI0015A6C591|nr:tetratricopeptide repeat protein [Bradyrhizobium sp. OK095]